MPSSVMPKIVSVDDHVIEPANLWTDRLPAKWRDVGPSIERRHIKDVRMIPPGTYELDLADDGDPADCWLWS